jgi:hypothetical protein
MESCDWLQNASRIGEGEVIPVVSWMGGGNKAIKTCTLAKPEEQSSNE